MKRGELFVVLMIVCIFGSMGYAIYTNAESYEPEPPHAPTQKDWLTPYVPSSTLDGEK